MPDWLQYVVPPLVLIAVMAGIIAYAFGGRRADKTEPPEPPVAPEAIAKRAKAKAKSKPESGEPWAERARLMRRLRQS